MTHDVHTAPDRTRASQAAPHRTLGILLFVLAGVLVLNSVLGPLATGVIGYPIAETVRNQLIGLELVSVLLVAPLSAVAGILALRGHRAAGVLGFGPAAYTAYMFAQYVLGPQYRSYNLTVLFHVGVFSLGAAVALVAWTGTDSAGLPALTRVRERWYGVFLLALAAFVASRYAGVLAGTGSPIAGEFAGSPAFYWTIVLLDLGVVVPGTAVAGVALIRGARAARTALYAVLGWFALVPPSVAAMGLAMVVNDDPYSSAGQTVLLGGVSVLFLAVAVWIYRPVLTRVDG